MPGDPYDEFADVYDAWVGSAPATRVHVPFYAGLLASCGGTAVELGVGNGRICIEAARRGKHVIGVDRSRAMLDLCRERAEQAGVAANLALIQADFRDFELPEPADLIVVPFHAIGHLLTDEKKLAGLRRMHGQLAPGGELVLDHFVCDAEMGRAIDGVPHLRAQWRDEETERDVLLWITASYDWERRVVSVLATTEALDDGGLVVERRVRRNSLSWIDPEPLRALLERAGLEVLDVWGDFEGKPLEPGDGNQVWRARRPA